MEWKCTALSVSHGHITQSALDIPALFTIDKSHTNTMTLCYDSKQESAKELPTPKQIFLWELNVLTFAESLMQLACIAKTVQSSSYIC